MKVINKYFTTEYTENTERDGDNNINLKTTPCNSVTSVVKNSFWTAVLSLFIVLLLGCSDDMFNPPQAYNNFRAGTGTVLLSINGQNAGRTIMPDNDSINFVEYKLEFTAKTGGNVGFDRIWAGKTGTIELNVGDWELTVTGFFEDSKEAAKSSAVSFSVNEGSFEAVDVKLVPIEIGEGTFSWEISFDSGSFQKAEMEIWLVGDNGNEYIKTIELIADGVQQNTDSETVLNSGEYRVVFVLSDGKKTVKIHETLYVYKNMKSHYDETFTEKLFLVELIDYIIGTWNSTSEEWDLTQAGISAGHFSLLGIAGINENNFLDMIELFNELCAKFEAPEDLIELKELVDMALVIEGKAEIEANAVCIVEKVQDEIADLIANESALSFDWVGSTVTVTIGDYKVDIVDAIDPDTHTDDCGCPYIVTGSGTEFRAIRGENGTEIIGTDNQSIQTVIDRIRANAVGKDVTIHFDGGTEPLNIGSSNVNFATAAPAWGEITLTGRITSSYTNNAASFQGTILVNGQTITSTADIANTGGGMTFVAININSGGTVTINGGTVSVTSGGYAIQTTNNNGTINISGGEVKAETGRAIYNSSTSAINISGGIVKATTGRAISNEGTGNVTINGGTVEATTGVAIYNTNTGKITISQETTTLTCVTSANTSIISGTISLAGTQAAGTRLEITGGTIQNTATGTGGNAIYNASTNGGIIISGGTITAGTSTNPFALLYAPTAIGSLTLGGGVTLENVAINATATAHASIIINSDWTGSIANLDLRVNDSAFNDTTIGYWTGKPVLKAEEGFAITANQLGNVTLYRFLNNEINPLRATPICGYSLVLSGDNSTANLVKDNSMHLDTCSCYFLSNSGSSYTISRGLPALSDSIHYHAIQTVIDTIRTRANGNPVTIHFDGGAEPLDIGNANIRFIGTWGEITLTGRITTSWATSNGSERGTIIVNGQTITSTADIANTQGGGNALAININSGTVYINGGTVSAYGIAINNFNDNSTINISNGTVSATSVSAIYNGNGTTNISGGTVSATGTYVIESITGKINISGGTVSATSGTAISNGNGTTNISGGTVSATSGWAITNASTGIITISQTSPAIPTLVKSANASNTAGTISLSGSSASTDPRLIIEGGTILNEATGTGNGGHAIYNASTNGGIIISGGTITSSPARINSFALLYAPTAIGSLTLGGGVTLENVAINAINATSTGNASIIINNDWTGSIANLDLRVNDSAFNDTTIGYWTGKSVLKAEGGHTITNTQLGQITKLRNFLNNVNNATNPPLATPMCGYSLALSGDTPDNTANFIKDNNKHLDNCNCYFLSNSGSPYTISRGLTPPLDSIHYHAIQTVIDTIRTRANGSPVTIQFGGGGDDQLDIGAANVNFNNTGGTWGEITLTGRITTSWTTSSGNAQGTILVNGQTISSTADIANTGGSSNSVAININSGGTVTINGGTVSVTSTGKAINTINTCTININDGTVSAEAGRALYIENGTINISGGIVSATTGSTIWNITGTINISGGTVQSTSGTAINNTSTGAINISGGTVQSTSGIAIDNNANTGRITISETTDTPTKITSANITNTAGTIWLSGTQALTAPRLIIEGGTIQNTAAAGTGGGHAIYNASTNGGIIISGGTITSSSARTGSYALLYAPTAIGSLTLDENATLDTVAISATENAHASIIINSNWSGSIGSLDLRVNNATVTPAAIDWWLGSDKPVLKAADSEVITTEQLSNVTLRNFVNNAAAPNSTSTDGYSLVLFDGGREARLE